MINFFRKIRQSLLHQNRITKYLLYALGEIILVAIGILMALQINNNNEQRKNRAYEVKMLKELFIAIDNDILYTENHILGFRTHETEKSVSYFKNLLIDENISLDSLKHYFEWTTFGVSYQLNEGPYQAIKSVGLDKISNDSLRNKIQLFYDFSLPRNRQLVKWGEDNYEEKQEPLKKLFYDQTKFSIQNNGVLLNRPLVKGKFWLDANFLELLRLTELRINWRRNRFEEIVKEMKSLKQSIEKELN